MNVKASANAKIGAGEFAKGDGGDDLTFVGEIGHMGEPSGAELTVAAARDFWQIAPKLREIDPRTGQTVAENNVGAALKLINLLDGDARINHEPLLLAALTQNVPWGGESRWFNRFDFARV